METQNAIDNPRKRSRGYDDDFSQHDPDLIAIPKRTRLTPSSSFQNANAPTCDFAPPTFAATWIQSADSSAASTPASMDVEMDIDPFQAAAESAAPAAPSLPPQAQQAQGQGTIISGWNQARRMELCVQGYPPALQLELSRWARAQA